MDFQGGVQASEDSGVPILIGEDCDALPDTIIPTIMENIVANASSRDAVDDLVAELSIDSTAVQMMEDLKGEMTELSAPTDCLTGEEAVAGTPFDSQTREEDSFDSFKAPLAPDHLVMSSIPLEEDSQSSFKAPFNPEVPTHEEDSQGSVSSQRSTKKRWEIADLGSQRASIFRAENLFEYQWPAGGGGDYYILQEQISEYLGVKSFKRKYPDLHRKPVEMDEKEFLKERGVVTETQCDLGLTALRSDEVIDLMVRDYFDKYQEYERVLHEKEKLSINEKHRGYSAPSVEKSKMSEFIKRSMRSAADWNFNFNRERNEERNACFDLQTNTIHYPLGRRAKADAETTKSSSYPLALIPGQFQEYYRKFTQVELKYLPVNTVLYGPRKRYSSSGLVSGSDGSQSDSEDSSCSEGSSSGSTRDGSGDSTAGEASSQPKPLPQMATITQVATPQTLKNKRKTQNSKKARLREASKNVPSEESPKGLGGAAGVDTTLCRVCHQEKEPSKDGKQNDMIHCSLCRRCAHSSCLDFPSEMVATIKTYPWQCMDCKMCMMCLDPYDEDKMMFCDKCDRGYHTFCVGLKTLPSGPWVCFACGRCGICGTTTPGAEGSKAQWFHEYSKSVNGSRELKQTLCLICSRMKRAR